MDRNLSRRVEVVFPIEPPELKKRLIDDILMTALADNVKARELQSDGTWVRVTRKTEEPEVRSQARFLELAAANLARWQAAAAAAPTPSTNGEARAIRRPRKPARKST